MDKKVKSLDITTLLSLIFYIAAIAFCVMGYVFVNSSDGEFSLSNIDFNQESGVAKLLFIVGCAFAGLAVISGTVVGIIYLITDWGNEELNKKTKLAGILNLIPVCLSIPANIVTRSLVKEFVHDEPKKSKKDKKASEEKTSTQAASNPAAQQQGTQAASGQQQPQPARFQAPINQSFQYNGKWMYFDGTTYYEADANNQWVVSSTIPQ